MASPFVKSNFVNENTPPQAHEQEEEEEEEDMDWCGCGCFQVIFRRWRHNDAEGNYLLQKQDDWKESWWMEKLKKMKEISEVMAGPKWKTFIRRCSSLGIKKKRRMQFQYDPYSYALNFDSGVNGDTDLSFSARFAAPIEVENRRVGP